MKYELNDILWVMRSNHAELVKVNGRQMIELIDQPITYSYRCVYRDGLVRWQWEEELFPTETALKNSL